VKGVAAITVILTLALAGCGNRGISRPDSARSGGPRRAGSALAIPLGGRQLRLAAGRGSLWVLTCDRGCTARSRPNSGRVLRIDPDNGRVIASTGLGGGTDLAVGAGGVYVTNFWTGTVRRLNPRTLAVTAKLTLELPFELVPGDRAFLPSAVATTARALWVSTARGVLARLAPDLSRVTATVRLPFDATGDIGAQRGAVWSAEQLGGVYRVDPATNRVVARIRVGRRGRRLAFQSVVLGGGKVYAIGVRTGKHQVATGRHALARIDPLTDRVEAVTSLPIGAGSTFAYGAGALWVAQLDGPGVYRIDPATGQVTDRLAANAAAGLLVADGWLWTASPGGTVQRRAALRVR
jgi:DNA-binding beta-propeller fold protein YncE